eukprot:CAMPEP_0206502828 /NCGR_PEP_ID=MMETSP0324_2-20121206/54272_1 /ASSEMBLY_ACC=CAM_ASM_000836 /TAXON_ID=2866 /ORGANISM="Crypthecodinium cohnii, Strain Seligo" /LENGTH=707 /DNA_ID=CAMNT_0053991181 /DNA_START=109 /DNA_END=2230 /DNA_ORIENTATION=-
MPMPSPMIVFLALAAAAASSSSSNCADAVAVQLGARRAAAADAAAAAGVPEGRVSFAKHGSDWKQGNCASRNMQSPITINELYAPAMGQFFYRYRDFAGGNFTFSNDGRTLYTDLVGKNVGYVSLPHAEATQYELSRIEFHSPSEHTLRGAHLPLEVQLVHRLPTDHPGKQLVTVSILFNCSSALLSTMQQTWPGLVQTNARLRAWHKVRNRKERSDMDIHFDLESESDSENASSNASNSSNSSESAAAAAAATAEAARAASIAAAAPLKAFVRSEPPASENSREVVVPKGTPMQLGSFLANGTFAMYRGSQTLPPCSETVVWLVRREAINAPSKEVKLLFDRLLETSATNGNFRTVMPLNQRPIEFWHASELPIATPAGSSLPGVASNSELETQARDAIAIAMAASDYAKGLSNRISEGAVAGQKAFEAAAPASYGLAEATSSTTMPAPPPTGPEGDIWAAKQIGNLVKEAISKSVTQSLQEVIPATSELAATYMKQALAKAAAAAAAAAAKQAAPTYVPLAVPVTFSVLVLNIDFAMLVANPALKTKFESTAISAAATTIGNGIAPKDITATLAPGSVRIDFLIQVPVQLNAAAIQDRIAAGAGELGAFVTRALAALPDLITVSTGSTPEVAEVGPPVILPSPTLPAQATSFSPAPAPAAAGAPGVSPPAGLFTTTTTLSPLQQKGASMLNGLMDRFKLLGDGNS